MRKFLSLIFIVSIFIISCGKKTRNVHFYGKAWVECDGSPVRYEEVKITVFFDGGMSSSSEVATALTNENGEYSVVSDVEYAGIFEHYEIVLTNKKYASGHPSISGNSENSHDVNCDFPSFEFSKAHIHIRNTQPIDSNDYFDRFYYSSDSNNFFYSYQALELQGTGVDTTIIRDVVPGRLYYKYSYSKNGIYSVSPVSFFDVECRKDVYVDIYY